MGLIVELVIVEDEDGTIRSENFNGSAEQLGRIEHEFALKTIASGHPQLLAQMLGAYVLASAGISKQECGGWLKALRAARYQREYLP